MVRKKEPPIIIKNKRLSIVTEEEYELANRKRLEHKNELESRKNKLDFIYDFNGKKLIYSKDEYGFYYTSKVFQLSEKTLIKMLYTDAILVLEKIKKDKKFVNNPSYVMCSSLCDYRNDCEYKNEDE